MQIGLTFFHRLLPYLKSKIFWAVFICGLVHVSGAIGMVFFDRDAFLELTSVNLILMFVLLLWTEDRITPAWIYSLLIIFITGVVTEIIGVNTGILFGSYSYGDFFGMKIMDVPLIIGVNWFCIVYCCFILASRFIRNRRFAFVLIPFFTAILTTAFDWIMEPAAVTLTFWNWKGGVIPLLNYASWFIITFVLVRIMLFFNTPTTNRFSIYLLGIQASFFIFLRIML
ncbi:MAG: carotenoid biosynthesis protein [bacterium]|jgi:putative membrane protein